MSGRASSSPTFTEDTNGIIRFQDSKRAYRVDSLTSRLSAVHLLSDDDPQGVLFTDKFDLERDKHRWECASAIAYRVDPDTNKQILISRDVEAELQCLSTIVARRRTTSPPKDTTGHLPFPDTKPWPEPVEGAELLRDIAAAIRRFVVADSATIDAAALWSLAAHAHDAFLIFPNLAIVAPDSQCGKSTMLMVIEALVPRPIVGTNITGPALFRAIEQFRPTLMLDEGDTFINKDEALRGILNSGHTKRTASVMRTVKVDDVFKIQTFSTWCPKVLAGIGRFEATLESRCILARLRRKTNEEHADELDLSNEQSLDGLNLRAKCMRWAADRLEALKSARPSYVEGLSARQRNNWRPLFAVADAAGLSWATRGREAALTIIRADADDNRSPGSLLLEDLQAFFANSELGYAGTKEILEYLNDLDDRPWGEWRRGEPMIAKSVSKLLTPYGVRPTKWGSGKNTVRGYVLDAALKDAIERYGKPPQAPQAPQAPASPTTEIVSAPSSPPALPNAARAASPPDRPPCFGGLQKRSSYAGFDRETEDGFGYDDSSTTCLVCYFEIECSEASRERRANE